MLLVLARYKLNEVITLHTPLYFVRLQMLVELLYNVAMLYNNLTPHIHESMNCNNLFLSIAIDFNKPLTILFSI